jgi:urea ABC transporter permease protein UrtC/urea ABC transporter ATP-binding protein UrtD
MSDVELTVASSAPIPAQKRESLPLPAPKTGAGLDVWLAFFLAIFGIPGLYLHGNLEIETVAMLGRFLAFAIVAVSLDLLWGYTGILCLCQSLFFALGGYAMGMYLAMHGELIGGIPYCLSYVSSEVSGAALPWFWRPFAYLPLAVLLGLLVPGAFGLIIGYFGFASRVRGVYFSILTMAVTMAAWLVFCMNNMRLCGTNGLTSFGTLAGYSLTDPNVKLGLFVVTVVALGGVYALCYRITKSRLGRVLVAIRDNETRLRFSGYRPHQFKVFAFTLAAMIGGLGGMLYAPQEGIFTPDKMTTMASNMIVVWVAVGGRGRLKGAVFGALLVNLIYNYLTSRAPEFWPFVLGGLFVGAAVLFTNGMINLRGAVFLAWLFAAPPILRLIAHDKDASGGILFAYFAYWALWGLAGGLLFWLLADADRINRPLRQFGQLLLAWTEPLPFPLRKPVEVWTGMLGATVPSRGATENGGEARTSEAKAAAPGGDLQKRLARIATLTRKERPIAPEGSLLKVKNVTVRFDGFKALDIDSLELNPFELRVIIGPNGAGKTTLCDVISGKTRPAEGSVTFANSVITGLSEAEIARRGVGRKFQTPTVFNSLTVFENMELALPGRQALYRCFVNSATAEETDKIFSILDRVRLSEHAHRKVQYLSHGQRQWLEISMLILAAPMLLLVDEPAAGLTDEETVLTAELLLELQEEHSIIVIEHDMEFVRLLGSRVTVLNEGSVMADGSLDEVKKDPKVIEAYLGR